MSVKIKSRFNIGDIVFYKGRLASIRDIELRFIGLFKVATFYYRLNGANIFTDDINGFVKESNKMIEVRLCPPLPGEHQDSYLHRWELLKKVVKGDVSITKAQMGR